MWNEIFLFWSNSILTYGRNELYEVFFHEVKDWRWAMQLFQEIRATDQLPTLISYNNLISTVSEGKKALELLAECTGGPECVTL